LGNFTSALLRKFHPALTSGANVEACANAGIEPLIAKGRQTHYPPLGERLAQAPPPPANPTPVEAMAHRLKTPEGKRLYGNPPVFNGALQQNSRSHFQFLCGCDAADTHIGPFAVVRP